jgi:DNA-binding IclR family transcriptional regulator
MFNVNFVGSRILELLKSGHTELGIVDEIAREFDVRRNLAENDVHEFLQTLKKCHLVEDHEPGSAVLNLDQDHGIDTTVRSRDLSRHCARAGRE